MKPEYLESLLLDRELGELSPAVAELLATHLALDADAARRASDLRATLQLARRATASPPAPPPRALDVSRLRRTHHAMHAAAQRTELYRLAACLALGLGLGWFARPVSPPTVPSAVSSQTSALAAISPIEPRSTFWSVARLTASQRAPAAAGATMR